MPQNQSTTQSEDWAQSKNGTNPTNTLRSRLANLLFGDIISQATSHAVRNLTGAEGLSSGDAATAAISVRVDDSPGWQPVAPSGPHDRDYTEWLQDQEDALEAWRKNFLAPTLVWLTLVWLTLVWLTLVWLTLVWLTPVWLHHHPHLFLRSRRPHVCGSIDPHLGTEPAPSTR